MSTTVIANPCSAGGKTGSRVSAWRSLIEAACGAIDVQLTSRAGEATELTRAALTAGAKRIVAVGGDGTFNEVANGFFDATRKISDASLGFVPAGTGGDFRKTIGIPNDWAGAVALLSCAPRLIDVGRLTYTADEGERHRLFVNIASFGIGGLVDHYVNNSSKALGGTLAFAIATLKAGLRYQNARVELVVDGTKTEARIYNVAVANGRYFGGGMKVAPNASVDDGQFDVVTLGDFSFGDLLRHGLDIYSGAHLNHPKVSVTRAKKVTATSRDGEVLLDVDGEQLGRLPATFEMLPRALLVHAP